MSYCVNCGVKLSNSEKKCPLCNTRVINPNVVQDNFEPAYSNNIEFFQTLNYKFIAKLILIILVVLTLITVLCDLIISKKISWSIYVIFSMLCFSSHLSFLLFKKAYLSHTLGFISLELLLFVIAYLNNGMHWYIYLILPFVFILWTYIMLCTFFIRKRKKSLLRSLSICLLFSSFALIGIECGIDLFRFEYVRCTWSLYASLPIIIISILMFLISFNKKLIDEIKQRIFI